MRSCLRPPSAAAALCGVLVLARPAAAVAANEAHVRTPVVWPSECARVVDRSVDPIAHFDYSIPVEDTELTPDELPDSRTHQFVALCRQHPLTPLLPPWITRDDVDRSVAAGLLEPDEVSYREILDETSVWADCFARITADDDRRPITFAQAELGVDWDTSTVAAGVWAVAGYTFEPSLNLWRDRPGFVKVLDDPDDPQQDLPAVALLGDEQIVEPGEVIELEACVDLLGPGQIMLEWARFAPSLDWQPLDTIEVDDGPLALEIPAPIAAAESEILLRARLVDALGREFVAHAPARVGVLPCPDAGCAEPPAEPEDDGGSARGCSTIFGPNKNSAPTGLLILIALLACPKTPRARRADRT